MNVIFFLVDIDLRDVRWIKGWVLSDFFVIVLRFLCFFLGLSGCGCCIFEFFLIGIKVLRVVLGDEDGRGDIIIFVLLKILYFSEVKYYFV